MNPVLHALRFLFGTLTVLGLVAIGLLVDTYTALFGLVFWLALGIVFCYVVGWFVLDDLKKT